jgi:predicted Zn finger-like uncharacterized protein
MILTCPSCDTRYSVDGAKFPAAGRNVRCAKCSHSWHQMGEAAEGAAAAPEAVSTPAPETPEIESASADISPARSFAPPPAAAIVEPEPRAPLGPKLAVVAGWAGLIAAVLLIAYAAVHYRQHIASIWPQSAGVYSSLGLKVNVSGLEFKQVDYRRETEDGQAVLAVSGTIVNTGSRELPVPQTVRVTLSDLNNHELYHWNFKPNAQLLKPGQSVPFVTRLASPPAAARHLEVGFAKDGS